MPAYTSYYRFVVTATNSTYSTTTTSTSTSVSVVQPAPINTVAPAVTPSSGNQGVATFTTTNGTWDPIDTDGVYAYQWQFYDSGSLYANISGATSSTFSPASNHISVYGTVLRCKVTATNSSGSTSATSNEVTVTTPLPTGGSITLSPSGTQLSGTELTASTTGWTGSPTSYSVRIYASTSNPPPGGVGSVLKTSSTTSSVKYTITNSDATPPVYYFKAFATATNASGTSTEVESNVVTSKLPSASALATADGTATPGNPSSITVANTANSNEGKVSWTNGADASTAWVSSVTPGSSYTGTDGGTLLTEQLFTITSSTTATATVNNKNKNRKVNITWTQEDAASYSVNYTLSGASAGNGTYTSSGNTSGTSGSLVVTLGTIGGTVRANYVTVYTGATQTGGSYTFTPTSAPSTTPSDKTSSNTNTGSITYTTPTLAAPTFGTNFRAFGGFTGNVSNYSVSNTYSFSVDNGSVSVGTPPVSGSTYAFTVSGLTVGQSATVTVNVSRTGYTGSSGTTSSGASTYYIRATGLGNVSAPYIRFVVGALGSSSVTVNVGRSTANGGTKTFLASSLTYPLTSGVTANLDFSSRTGTTSNWYLMTVTSYSGAGGGGSATAIFQSSSDKQGSDTTTSTVFFSTN